MRIQKIELTGEGKSAVATPDGKSRNKKKKFLGYLLQAYPSTRKRDVWSNGLRRLTSNLAILA